MNKLDRDYQNLILDILNNGVEKDDRTGTGTISVFGRSIRHNMSDGFPLLTTKELNFRNIWTELVWFLNGDTNIKYLVNAGNNIWVGDAYKHYLQELDKLQKKTYDGPIGKDFKQIVLDYQPLNRKEFIEAIKNDDDFAKKWGDMGPIYGKQWRDFNDVDQIINMIQDLLNNPDSRRIMVNAWNVSDIPSMKLPPCHYGFQVYTRVMSNQERIKRAFSELGNDDITLSLLDRIKYPTRAVSLMWNQRSVDTGLGLPYNIASYGLLLTMIASEVGMIPDELIGNLGDTHIYKDHIEGLNTQLDRESFELPRVIIQDGMFSCCDGDFVLENYKCHPTVKLKLSN